MTLASQGGQGAAASGPACNIHINAGHCPWEGPKVIKQKLACSSHQGLQFTHGNLH